MGNLVMGKCKDKQRKSYNTETNCKHSKGGYGRLSLDNVYTYHDFF
jgi:L,D-peptidoglycan transpeptidase YkuD (ErfK/YbiS/YcfS/YnhG family)